MQVNMHEAKTHLSRLGERAWQGEEVIIARDGEPYLYLLPYRGAARPRPLGLLRGQIWMAPDFDETPQEVIDAFHGTASVDSD